MQDYKKLVKKMIGAGKPLSSIKKILVLDFIESDKVKYWAENKAEYDRLFPEFEEMTEDEYLESVKDQEDPIAYGDLEEIPKLKIDYSEDEDFVTYEKYKAKTRVIKEAIPAVWTEDSFKIIEEEVPEIKGFDENGKPIIVQEFKPAVTEGEKPSIITPEIPEVAELIFAFIPKENYDEEINIYLENDAIYKERLTNEKLEKLSKLIVTHNSIAYDADGRAVGNMGAVVALANFRYHKCLGTGMSFEEAYKETYKNTKIGWKSADNKVHLIQVESIAMALEKSMLEIGKAVGA